MIWITLGIIIASIAGLVLSRYITKHKHKDDHKICPVGKGCHTLFTGRYSRFLGMSNEHMGSAYFIIMILIHGIELFYEIPNGLFLTGLLLSVIALGFSLYLTIIQIFVVKKWCTLALGAGALVLLIAILSFLGYERFYIEFAYTYRDLLKWLYGGSVILGTLITTLHSFSFIKFLKDLKITRREEKRLEMFSHSGWAIQGLALLSGLGIIFTDYWREYTDSTAFSVMLIVMGMLIVYEVVLNMIISPRLTGMHFGDHPELDDHKHTFYRKIAFAFVGVGLVSWYSLLLLMTFNWFSYSSGALFVGYLGLLVIAVIITSIIEHMMYKKSVYVYEEEHHEEHKNEE